MVSRSTWTEPARLAADEVQRAREVGEQLGLFDAPTPVEPAVESEWKGRGRKPGSRNKGKLGLAEWMAAQGWRAPGEAVALAAGLNDATRDPFQIAFARAVWLREASGLPPDPAGTAAMAMAIWKEMTSAATALLPYTLARLGPLDAPQDEAARPSIGIAAPSAAVAQGARRPRLAPADLRAEGEADQRVGDAATGDPDRASRTESASD